MSNACRYENDFLWKFANNVFNAKLSEDSARELLGLARKYYTNNTDNLKPFLKMVKILESNCESKKQRKLLRTYRKKYDQPLSDSLKEFEKIKRKNSGELKRLNLKRRASLSKLGSIISPRRTSEKEESTTKNRNKGPVEKKTSFGELEIIPNNPEKNGNLKRVNSLSRLPSYLSNKDDRNFIKTRKRSASHNGLHPINVT